MSQSNTPASAGDQQGKLETAKEETAELKDTAQEQAGEVASTVKAEAASVADDAKTQAKDLYRQTQSELREQAGVQQQRVASGLRSVGDELASMASASEQPGVAADLVQQAAGRARGAAEWLDERDPGSLLHEVKTFARRKPGTFIAAAAIAGVVVGRLTRALASGAADDGAGTQTGGGAGSDAGSRIRTTATTGTATATGTAAGLDTGAAADLGTAPDFGTTTEGLDPDVGPATSGGIGTAAGATAAPDPVLLPDDDADAPTGAGSAAGSSAGLDEEQVDEEGIRSSSTQWRTPAHGDEHPEGGGLR